METNKQGEHIEKTKTTDWRAWSADFQRQLAEYGEAHPEIRVMVDACAHNKVKRPPRLKG